MQLIRTPKKLIEVALPLDDINQACVREKSIRHGHPSTLHLWWARRPLAAARAVIFAQMVNDPGYERSLGRGVNKEKAAIERERLFGIIRRLVLWENTNNEEVLAEARAEIWKSWRETCALNKGHPRAADLFNPDKLPAFHDPFAGGGAIPLEAQRLGLESHASDLNPVAVLINKAMIEIPPRFAGKPPVNPEVKLNRDLVGRDWQGAQGLAEDVRYYGQWMRDEAEKRIGHLYPKIEVTAEMAKGRPDLKPYVGKKLVVIAWLWARTVKSPNPVFANVDVPLVSSFILSAKSGKEAYIEPIIENGKYQLMVKVGNLKNPEIKKRGTKLGRGSNFECLMSGTPIAGNYIKTEGKAGRIGVRLLAAVAEGERARIYLSPTEDMEQIAWQTKPKWRPDSDLVGKCRDQLPLYGMNTFADMFTSRQLVTLTTFSDLAPEVRGRVLADAMASGIADDGLSVVAGGNGATAYADSIAMYLGLAMSRFADRNNSLCTWDSGPVGTKSTTGGSARTASIRNLFSRQAIQMAWDFGEANPFSDSGGSYTSTFDWIVPAVAALSGLTKGVSIQADASSQNISRDRVISTDPPYYDNICYADLSDFFYVWLRRSLRPVFPDLFSTIAVPKAEELVATPYRYDSKEKAETFFLEGMTQAMHRLAEQAHPGFPVTIYYAFKQSDTTDEGTGNTGWETFLEAVVRAGFAINGTWPMRTELSNRMIGSGTNALASSIILVCRQRDANSPTVSRREFLREMKEELAEAVEIMIGGAEGISPIAPVDLAQAVIGPGMAIFSKYSAVLEADGSAMTVHSALKLINQLLIDDPGAFDADTQFCIGWFDEMGWAAGEFGQADVLARAKGTSVPGVVAAGVLEASRGKVRLLKTAEYPDDWSPEQDNRTPVWEALHQMIRALQSKGETAAGELLAHMPERSEPIRALAYRLYTLCERKGWAEEARGYNELVTSWHTIEVASHEAGRLGEQGRLDV